MNSETKSTSKSDNSYFDPPIENYRFYYQGAAGNTANFTIRQRKKGNKSVGSVGDRLLDDGTERSY